MPYQLVHKGVVREFEFFPPIGWHYWHERAFDEDGRHGLPLVIALHGGGQSPATFATDWPFPLVSTPIVQTNWEDRFFVLYPYGSSYSPGLAGEPLRGWNVGFADDFLPVHSDVSFIQAAVDAVEEMVQRKLDELGVKRRAIDPDRRFVFGYSMGGMLAYRLAHELPNQFAALWVMSGAIGGRSHEGLTGTVMNVPQGGPVSLFAHHGELDDVVPPGPQEDASGRVQGTHVPDLYAVSGMPAADIAIRKTSFRHLAAAIETFKLHNDCEETAYFNLLGTDGSTTTAADVGGTSTSLQYIFRRIGNPANPEVIVYRDPLMEHANFTSAGQNRYFKAVDVWNFFKGHPRVPA
jgi:poly(3-hydroxybutyrate) depolymerase